LTKNTIIKFLGEIPGYIWVFPGKDFTNIGIGSEIKYGSKLKLLLDSFILSEFPQINLVFPYAAMLPSAGTPDFFDINCSSNNWMLIGDAAGHVDPISGGGIFYALWGARLAAQAIVNNDPASFDGLWRRNFGYQLVKSCREKSDFYDPVRSTVAIMYGLINGKYFLV
jgi:flavin-dependent dehydrogenase